MEYVRVRNHVGRVSHYVVLDDDHWRIGSVHREPDDRGDDQPRRWWAETNDHQPLTDDQGRIRYWAHRSDAAAALLELHH